MRPLARLANLPDDEARRFEGVFFDLDDTALTHGELEREAFDAMCDASAAGLVLVALTGRPCAWGEVLARQWPVVGVIVENGALAVVRDGPGVRVIDPVAPALREFRTSALAHVKDVIARELPELRPADDAWCRRTDTTWDIGERERAPADLVARATALLRREGAVTFASSVHLHATFDRTDKAQGAVRFLRDRFAHDEARTLARFAFIGDSANDASCFAAFHRSFGVANVRRHLARLPVPPRWVAGAEMGRGFAEILSAILAVNAALDAPTGLSNL